MVMDASLITHFVWEKIVYLKFFQCMSSHCWDSPVIIVPLERLVKRRNQQVVLECSVHANPMEIYYMEHLSKKIKTSDRRRLEETKSRSDLRILRLYIPFIANSDFGEYKCFAANKLGQSEVHMSLSGDYFNIIFISLSSFIFLPFY